MAEKYKTLFDRYRDSTVIQKSLQYAKWTLPQLMADTVLHFDSTAETLERDYQEIGPLLTNGLASKMASLLFPANRPFFKANLSKVVKELAVQKGNTEAELNSRLAVVEVDASQALFVNASYNHLVLLIKRLIVTGNALLYRDSANKRTTCYGIQQYGVRRDAHGVALDIILKEKQYFDALPLDVQQKLRNTKQYKDDTVVDMYTRIRRVQGESGVRYEVSQEVEDIAVGTPGSYTEHLCPWRACTWTLLPGEHYGRGLVEDYAGGFAKLSDQSLAATLYGIEVMRLINLVAPGGGDVDAFQDAECGEYVQGDPAMVHTHESGDADKLQAVYAELDATFQRLAKAFMYSGNVRNAERVTAFEIRQDAMEADISMGGAYSVLSEGIQIPLAHWLVHEVSPELLVGLVSGDIKLEIVAGIPALGRASEVQNLVAAANDANVVIPVLLQTDPRISKTKVSDLIYASYSVDPDKILMSKEEQAQVQAAEQQAQQAQQQITQAAALGDQQQQLQEMTNQ